MINNKVNEILASKAKAMRWTRVVKPISLNSIAQVQPASFVRARRNVRDCNAAPCRFLMFAFACIVQVFAAKKKHSR